MTYHLLKNPAKMARLTKEIRTAFSSLEDINLVNIAQLEYLNAVIEEGLRIYPPVSVGLPRSVPEGGATVGGMWLPGGVSYPNLASFCVLPWRIPDSYCYRLLFRLPSMRLITANAILRTRTRSFPSAGCRKVRRSTGRMMLALLFPSCMDPEIAWGESESIQSPNHPLKRFVIASKRYENDRVLTLRALVWPITRCDLY